MQFIYTKVTLARTMATEDKLHFTEIKAPFLFILFNEFDTFFMLTQEHQPE